MQVRFSSGSSRLDAHNKRCSHQLAEICFFQKYAQQTNKKLEQDVVVARNWRQFDNDPLWQPFGVTSGEVFHECLKLYRRCQDVFGYSLLVGHGHFTFPFQLLPNYSLDSSSSHGHRLKSSQFDILAIVEQFMAYKDLKEFIA